MGWDGPTNCLSLTDEMLLLGVVTRASSHPVGSKSFGCTALELNVGAASANKNGRKYTPPESDVRVALFEK